MTVKNFKSSLRFIAGERAVNEFVCTWKWQKTMIGRQSGAAIYFRNFRCAKMLSDALYNGVCWTIDDDTSFKYWHIIYDKAVKLENKLQSL